MHFNRCLSWGKWKPKKESDGRSDDEGSEGEHCDECHICGDGGVRIFVITFSLFAFTLHLLLSVSNNLFLPVTKDFALFFLPAG